jgi:phosphomannomutase
LLYNTSMIFKAYDIRGIYGEQLNEDIAYKIGRAFAMYIGSKIVVAKEKKKRVPKSLGSTAKKKEDIGKIDEKLEEILGE